MGTNSLGTHFHNEYRHIKKREKLIRGEVGHLRGEVERNVPVHPMSTIASLSYFSPCQTNSLQIHLLNNHHSKQHLT